MQYDRSDRIRFDMDCIGRLGHNTIQTMVRKGSMSRHTYVPMNVPIRCEAISYRIVLNRIVLNRILSYRIELYRIVSYPFILYQGSDAI